ncbi:hypothetical protein [Pseudomonas sp. BGI-2]|uniref:hypothetical protein n=1 Tax=Pseudomonas sp. BGI-2 TaxID=2528211 RepID=UPI0010333182|nr:hypothetical protein [Pseudomonas sp. BGI-2]TBN49845.1 hypothetical protein EYC95_04255 [Pseudomonas sp. BGI-2]
MNISDNETELLPIAIQGHTFYSGKNGLWSLNEIHQTLKLSEAKRPSEWNNAVSSELVASGNFRKVSKVGSFADELGTIAYAMWVSTEFYLMVAHAFVKVRNDSILRTRMALIAAATSDNRLATVAPKAELIDTRLTGIGITWSQACRLAGVSQPQLAKTYLVSIKRFTSMDHPTEHRKILRPKPEGFSLGFFKACSTAHGNADGFRVTAKGLVWLEEKAKEINEACRQRNADVAKKARLLKAQAKKRGAI